MATLAGHAVRNESSVWPRFRDLVIGTSEDWSATAARIALGLVMFPHGAQKLFGWFGGYGWAGSMGFLTGQIGLPTVVATAVILIESLGSVALLTGFLARLAAAGIAAIMVGAVATVHVGNGFFMNWSGSQSGEGFEYHILALGLALVVILKGSGACSLDRLTAR